MDYKTQYQMYLSQASAALEDACAKFLPEESEVSIYDYLVAKADLDLVLGIDEVTEQ